jgi:hypothetical protein
MKQRAEKALERARDLGGLVRTMIPETKDLDLQRLLKQIDADIMDVQHKLSMAVKLSASEGK